MSGPDQTSPKGRKGAATPDGVRNDPPILVRDVITGAIDILGGAEGLAKWVEADEKNAEKFWTALCPKLLPLQLTGEDGAPIRIAAAIEAARQRLRSFDADRLAQTRAPSSPPGPSSTDEPAPGTAA